MVTNNNNNNKVIPTTERQGVSNRDMLGITTQQQAFFKMDLNKKKDNSVGIKKGSPIDKKIILFKKCSRRPISRKIETFCRSVDENNTGSQNFGYSKRIQNSISFETFSIKNPFPTNSESRRGRIGETGGKRNVEEGSHQKSSTIKGEFISNLFLVKKKDGGQRPVINLKQLNAYIPYCHFRMEGLQNLKYMLQSYMCKLDLKDAYFSVPLEKISRKFVRFRWSGNLYEFLCLCFGLGPAPRIFTKLLKVSMTILRKINIKIIT